MPLEMNALIIIAFGEFSNSNLAGSLVAFCSKDRQGVSKEINNL